MSARGILVLSVLLAAPAVDAQEESECDENRWWGWRGGPAGRVCEVRELTLSAGGGLSVDAGPNGSIAVTGENRRDVQVRATVQAWASNQAEAERIASAINVRSDGVLRAEGPEQRGRFGWSVSYRVLAPRDIDLTLETQNGSIEVAAVRGELELEARNGGIRLDGVAGNVRGRTTNGGVDAELTGRTWDGAGLDLETTNGGVRLRIPENYSARLETGTVNGGIDIDFPVTVQGRIGRELSTTLGNGGPLVRAETTNGQVRLTRDRGNLTRLP
jgi:DUF4097 and DUF4098 domain-containing protein YvlB